jgi:hypothetical protein
MVFLEEVSVHPKKIFNYFLRYGHHRVIDLVDVPSSFSYFGMAKVNNVGHVQLRVTNLHHDQRETSTSHQLNLYEVVNLMSTLEFLHQFWETPRPRIPRKHSTVHHGQCFGAKIQEISNLASAVLESHNSASAISVSLEVSTVFPSKSKKNLHSRVNTLILGSSVQKGA